MYKKNDTNKFRLLNTIMTILKDIPAEIICHVEGVEEEASRILDSLRFDYKFLLIFRLSK